MHFLKLREENNWLPDLDELKQLVIPGTKLIALTNPNNPTGSLIDKEMLALIAEIAAEAGSWILCDEVYRGTDQQGTGMTASITDIYEKGISTAGMSKAYSLAGLRLGWVTASHKVIEDVMIHRDYDTISVGMVDDYLATIALESVDRLLERSHKITRGNLNYLSSWLDGETKLSWVKPRSGTTALVKIELPIKSYDFCVKLLKETGVMFTPGAAMGMEGFIRVGYANNPEVLRAGLSRVSEYLKNI